MGRNPRGGIPWRSAAPLGGRTCVLLASALAQQLELLNFLSLRTGRFRNRKCLVLNFSFAIESSCFNLHASALNAITRLVDACPPFAGFSHVESCQRESYFLSSEHRLVGKLASALNLSPIIGLVFEQVESWQDAAVCLVTFNRGQC